MPKVQFDLEEIAKEFMAAYGGWYERMRVAKVGAQLAAEREQNEANYLAAGRRLERLSDKDLSRKWIAVLRRLYGEDRRLRNEIDDLSAELGLRKLRIDLPEDVRALLAGRAGKVG
ncbi:hypothetical protein [Bradyrhizobium genosp. P]|uniref:hypothetical protein n=1 Tax=Bradyrhizobium genosp. P TaxID=83641 RepID=UPI003CF44AF6